ncbi:SWIB/MDM2 domain-containing protein [Dichotomocladium elegans]|nr:SWIB/MDM2 domain-containing protein [Dichotomocladium elegans]
MDISEFQPRIFEILRQSDLDTITTKAVRSQLQLESGTSLDIHKKALNALITDCYNIVSQEREAAASSSSSEEELPLKTTAAAASTIATPKKDSVKKVAPKRQAEKPKKVMKPKKPRQQDPEKRERNNFTKTWVLSDDLAAVTGQPELSRPSVVKHVWQYIKEHNLQDPERKTHIFCDDKLKKIFDNESYMSTFTMNKYFGKHLLRPAVVDDSTQPSTAASPVPSPSVPVP